MRLIYLFWGVLLAGVLCGQSYFPGQTYFGENGYIEYRAGNLPVILTAPHGGDLSPEEIPDRDCSGCVYVNDAYTQELSREVASAIEDLTGCFPHLIINRLHRRKLDANRALVEAADGNPLAEQAWTDFHDFAEAAHDHVESSAGRGLHLDLHGHAHAIQRLELGYLLFSGELREEDEILDTPAFIQKSSIRSLVTDNPNGLNHSELLRGAHSLGTLIDDRGFNAVPGEADPFPQEGEPYFSGGYNTDRYGSDAGGLVDAIQVECNQNVRFNPTVRQRFADSLASAIVAFLEMHYFEDFAAGSCWVTDAGELVGAPPVQVFPNPACGTVQLELPGITPGSLILLDGLGREVRTFPNPVSGELSLERLPDGVYMLIGTQNKIPLFHTSVLVMCGKD